MNSKSQTKIRMASDENYVVKRDGTTTEPIDPNKITQRLKKLKSDVEQFLGRTLNVSVWRIAKATIGQIYDGITTSELDEEAAEVSAYITDDPDYADFAGNILVSNLEANNRDCMSFLSYAEKAYSFVDEKTGHANPLISDELLALAKKYSHLIDRRIVMSRNYLFDYFAFQTLAKGGYILNNYRKIQKNRITVSAMVPFETPQHMYMRVALGIHGSDLNSAFELYDQLSLQFGTMATPTLFNAGTRKPQCSSCFLLMLKSDSIEGIYDTIKQCALISKQAGGIGVNIHNVRANGSYIKGTNGTSNGLVPMLRVFNNTAKYVDQGGGKRKGSFAVYLEPWHADILAFLDLKQPNGAEDKRARDLFYALWVPDLFWKRVQKAYQRGAENEPPVMWSLMCPNVCPGLSDCWGAEFEALYEKYEAEKKYNCQIPIKDLMKAIMTSQIETGTPYMLNKDHCNRKSNQQNLGTIKSSNLCVSGDTFILTKEFGQVPIKDVVNQDLHVWNGDEWSKTTPKQTSESSELWHVTLNNGAEIYCTEYHKFIIHSESKRLYNGDTKIIEKIVDAQHLKANMKLIRFDLPQKQDIIVDETFECKYPYTQGLFAAEGTYANVKNGRSGQPKIALHQEKQKLMPFIEIRLSSRIPTAQNVINVTLPLDMHPKYFVPINASLKTKLEWLAGFLDGDGCTMKQDKCISFQASSIHKDFLRNIKYMLQTMGIDSAITTMREEGMRRLPDGKGGQALFNCQKIYRILVSNNNVYKLKQLGLVTHRLDISDCIESDRSNMRFVKVVESVKSTRVEPTYCFTEPIKNRGVFNGLLLKNCVEVVQFSAEDEISVCNLASLSLPAFVDKTTGEFRYDLLEKSTRIFTKALNKVIDVNCYPVKEAENSNMRNRPVGLGIQGLADVFIRMKLPFTSDQAKSVNRNIAEVMYFGAMTESHAMSVKEGAYPSMMKNGGAPISKGVFQFEMWKSDFQDQENPNGWKPDEKLNLDWEGLRSKILKPRDDGTPTGVRNSLVICKMPTASTSCIMGNTECFEPYFGMIYVRRTKAGEFFQYCRPLIEELVKLGLWKTEIHPQTKKPYIPIKEKIKEAQGSIQNIPEIPDDLKKIYLTVFDLQMKDLTIMARDRAVFTDQSESLNVYFKNTDNMMPKLLQYFLYSWKLGLKTSSYYCRTLQKTDALDFAGLSNHEAECLNCSA